MDKLWIWVTTTSSNPKNQSLTQCSWMGIHHFCEFPSQSQLVTSTQAEKGEPALRMPDAPNGLGSACSGETEYHGPFKISGLAIAISWVFRANISSWVWWQMPVIPALGLIQNLYELGASLGEILSQHTKTNQQNKHINRFQHTPLERKKKTNPNWGSTRVLCGIVKGTQCSWLLCYKAMEIMRLKCCSLRATEEERLPLQSQKSLPASAQKVQIPEQRCQWKYRMPFSFTFQKHNILVAKVYLRLPPVIWNSNSTECPVVWVFFFFFCCCWIWPYPRQHEMGILMVIVHMLLQG